MQRSQRICFGGEAAVIEAIIGIVGTLLGTILGWVLGRVDFGRLTTAFNNTVYEFSVPGSMCSIPGVKSNEVNLYKIGTTMQLYNSSNTNRVVRNVQFVFCDEKNDLLSVDAADDETRQNIPHSIRYENMEIANIPACTGIDLKIHVYTEDIDQVLKTKKIYIQYKNQRLKTKRVLLKTVDYSKQPRFISLQEDETNA